MASFLAVRGFGSAQVFGIGAGGTLYSPDFQAADMVHDLPILASR